jgi:hypothetical protein
LRLTTFADDEPFPVLPGTLEYLAELRTRGQRRHYLRNRPRSH